MIKRINHYDYLTKHLPKFFEDVGVSWDYNAGIIGAHGDKCYSYENRWKEANIPFEKGVAIYLLSYTREYGNEVRKTVNGWVDPCSWVISNRDRFIHHLP